MIVKTYTCNICAETKAKLGKNALIGIDYCNNDGNNRFIKVKLNKTSIHICVDCLKELHRFTADTIVKQKSTQ